jgi:hypothetical protein
MGQKDKISGLKKSYLLAPIFLPIPHSVTWPEKRKRAWDRKI